jgi:hypothetical protein
VDNPIRSGYLESARVARTLIGSPEVTAAWEAPSALAGMTSGAVAAHLARAVSTVVTYLDAPIPARDAPLVTASRYYVLCGLSPDLEDRLNRDIRRRSEQHASSGPAAVVAAFDAALDDVTGRLAREPADRPMTVIGGIDIALDEYLVTRMLECVVHSDDLAVSVGVPTPDFPQIAYACSLGCLLDIARVRHGDLAVVRGLARRERDAVDALRVL